MYTCTSNMYLFTVLLVISSLWDTVSSKGEYWDGISIHDKNQMKNITCELVRETKLKVRQINTIVYEISAMFAFEVGMIMGKMREKYKLMLDVYRQFKALYTKKTPLWPIGINEYFKIQAVHYYIGVEHIRLIEMDIDKMVHTLEALPTNVWLKNPMMLDPYYLNRDHLHPPYYRKHNKDDLMKEQNIKRQNRQQYLMRRLGLPPNMSTTMKRFLHQWPVRETWSLEKYNYN